MLFWSLSSWSFCDVVVKSFDFHPAVPGSIPSSGNFFKKSQIFLITRSFQKFWQKTWNQQLLFYYSMRRGNNWIVAPSSDSSHDNHCLSNSQMERVGKIKFLLAMQFLKSEMVACRNFWRFLTPLDLIRLTYLLLIFFVFIWLTKKQPAQYAL